MRMFAASLAALLAAGGFTAFASPAQAQGRGAMEVIVYGNDPCPRSSESEVVVCSRRPEAERYRIAEAYRGDGPRQQRESWTSRARVLETVGDTGTFSCSAVGPGGHTGCLEQLIKQSQTQRRNAVEGDTPPM